MDEKEEKIKGTEESEVDVEAGEGGSAARELSQSDDNNNQSLSPLPEDSAVTTLPEDQTAVPDAILELPTLMYASQETIRASNARPTKTTTPKPDVSSLFATPEEKVTTPSGAAAGERDLQNDAFLKALTANSGSPMRQDATLSSPYSETAGTPRLQQSTSQVQASFQAPPPPSSASPFMTPLRSNRSQSEGTRPQAAAVPQTVQEIPTLDDEQQRQQQVVDMGPMASSLRHRRVRSSGSVGMHSVTFEALRDPGEGDQHSLGDSLGDSDSFTYQDDDDDDDGLSITSKSLDSSLVRRVAARAFPEMVSTGQESTHHRLADGKTLQHTDRRVSLRPDLETGKTAGTRGQKVVRRSVSTMEPQPPRLRRRTGMKHMLQKVGGSFRIPANDTAVVLGDADDEGSLTGRHGRFLVESQRVIVPDSPRIDSSGQMRRRKSEHEEIQYRLSALTANPSKFNFRKLVMYNSLTQEKAGLHCLCGWHPNLLIQRYLFWAFRSHFVLVLLSAASLFYTFTLFFALILYLQGMHRPSCIQVNGVEFGTTQAPFMDAYALSWTTFSTVGYGLIYVGTSTTTVNPNYCTGVKIITSLEAFFGILFASMIGAVLFAKVVRATSHAQVDFSDCLIVKYGTGITGVDKDYDGSSSEEEEEEEEAKESSAFFPPTHIQHRWSSAEALNQPRLPSPGEDSNAGGSDSAFSYKRSKMPCPILEFRIVNRLEGQRGGEIIDSTLNIVASIDESQAALSVKRAASTRRRRGKRGRRRPRRATPRAADTKEEEDMDLDDEASIKRLQESAKSMIASRNKRVTCIEEDTTGKLMPKRIFAKLDVESQDHPFFKRVWIVRHILNQNSALLRQEARELVRLNGGHWPMELNNPEAVRASFHFDQLVVSLSGTSNVDASNVYAQKVYDYVDVCVGYTFCNMLYRQDDGAIGVDATLLNDVKEQEGGGGEDLDARLDEEDLHDVMIL